MVSPAPLAPANPPLSYADRARKAQQNARPSAPQQPLSRSSSQGTSSIAQVPSTTSTSRSNPPPSNPSRPSPPAPAGADPRIPTSATSSKSTSPPSADLSSDLKPNGDVNHHNDSLSSVPSPVVAQKHSSAPPVNVWNKRKEQMAATRALTQSRSSQPSQPSSSSMSAGLVVTSSLSSPPPTSLDVSAAPSASASANISLKSSPTMAPVSTNGFTVISSELDDPFVVKPGRSPSILNSTPPSIVTPPAIDDAESWPEVGHAATLPANVNNGRAEGKAKEAAEEERGHEREAVSGQGSRKSEKPKWVPAPEELQFEGQRNHHARPRPHNSNPRQPGGPSGTTSSSSGQGSQQQSRTHSAAGRRQTPSHAGSVSHSQTQSRTGSVQSSPRHASIRGGGRRLPEESAGPIFSNRSLRSSATNSPAAFAQPQPLPAEFIPGVGLRPYVNTNVTQTQPTVLSAIPDSAIAAATDLNPHAAYYQPPHGPPFGVSPYHSPHPAGSPANNPYPLPPMGYQGQPGIPPPMPMSGYGTPPYPMYPPYGYGYGQPYMYWPPPGAPPPQAMSVSPMTHPQQTDGVPPPTMLARPPPPHESDAVAGYRDVGFVLPPPPSEINRYPQGQGQGQGEERERERERGRRTRELSFGSIGAGAEGTSKSPSPARASPVLGSVPEGAALGLDVSGGQGTAPVPVQVDAGSAAAAPVGEKEQKDVSKAPSGLLIGVAPGEPTPARIRSRTHSKGPAASTSTQAESSTAAWSAGEQQASGAAAEDPVAALAEAAKIIHVTDPLPETKWEFGTTRQTTEGVADPQSEFSPPTAPPPVVDPSVLGAVGIPGANFVPMGPPYAPPFIPPVVIPGGPVNSIPSAASPSTYVPPRQPHSAIEDEWEVRDYGFGFGRGGPVYTQAPAPPLREERPYRGGRDYQGDREQHFGGRPRRGSYSQGGYGYERGERGAYTGRRGRGLPGGYVGRGYQNRSFSRGAYSNQQSRQQAYVPPAQQPPQQQEVNGYYAQPMPPAPLATYIPQAFEGYPYAPLPPPPPQMNASSPSMPLPMPQSNIGFPLDSTKYYLLGQLEYYLSPQNLAQDFYLRQQMDARGWIPITRIASFNRVRNLTTDVQLVTDVLALSSMLEVRNGHVRTLQWHQFVLPTATLSQVEDDGGVSPQDPLTHAPTVEGQLTNQNPDGEDEDDEDIEFVL